MSSISETSVWLKFFTEAGIPAGDATNYAIIFTDNRIKMDMLLDLNREYLRDMGITVMGDIIAILKHSKIHSGQLSRQRVMQASPPATAKRDPVVRDTCSPPPAIKKSTPASRILEHYVRKDGPPPSPPTTNSNISSRLSTGTKRTHEDDELAASNKRSSVFNRLGDNSVTSTTSETPKITITMHGKDMIRSSAESNMSSPPSVFGRLVYDEDESTSDREVSLGKPLEYQGILKFPSKETNEKISVARKVTKVETGEAATASVATMIADTTTGVKSRLGVKRLSSTSGSAGIFARESKTAVKTIKTPSKLSATPTVEQLKAKLKAAAAIRKTPTQGTAITAAATSSASSTPTTGKKFVKKIVRVNKKTGEIMSEEKITLKTDVFSRLGN